MNTVLPSDIISYNGFDLKLDLVPNLLFIDLECAAIDTYKSLSDKQKATWAKRANRIRSGKSEKASMTDEELYESEAGLYDEFSRVICVGLGKLVLEETEVDGEKNYAFRKKLKCVSNTDEAKLLSEVSEGYLSKNSHQFKFCGFNIHNFDMPFLRNRMHINRVGIPSTIRGATKKPWNSNTFDLMIYWQENNSRPYIGLEDLCLALGVDSPKDLCNNKDVQNMWRDGKIEEIKTYCKKDVSSNMDLVLRLLNAEHLLIKEN